MKFQIKHQRLSWQQRVSLALLASLAAWTAPAAAVDEAAQLALGKRLFTHGTVPACAVCHTLQAAGAEGAIGPILDELKPDEARVAKALRNGLGQMPSYKDKLSDAEITALARYVAKMSGGAR
uniref:Cytochrome C oxidase n=1 Tax=Polaromonas sp. E3S TaxID=1840265 RepID=A0A2S1FHX0_9BURK|nr:cytochrome c [Polaromonas sp. E3S]AWD72074.1 cytochrome C oxidase [Polaromonas sp. E3S]